MIVHRTLMFAALALPNPLYVQDAVTGRAAVARLAGNTTDTNVVEMMSARGKVSWKSGWCSAIPPDCKAAARPLARGCSLRPCQCTGRPSLRRSRNPYRQFAMQRGRLVKRNAEQLMRQHQQRDRGRGHGQRHLPFQIVIAGVGGCLAQPHHDR